PSQKERCPPTNSFRPGGFAKFLYAIAERSSDATSPGNFIYNFQGPSQAGALGDESIAHDVTVQKANVGNQTDLKALAKELTKLREYLAEHDTSDEHLALITKAESTAKKGDETSVRERLLKAGAWTLELAKEAGAPVLAAFLQRQLGLPK
ncbi:MAG: hypothetical protein WCA07_09410, partial [Gloeobacterales cyanobacterium]